MKSIFIFKEWSNFIIICTTLFFLLCFNAEAQDINKIWHVPYKNLINFRTNTLDTIPVEVSGSFLLTPNAVLSHDDTIICLTSGKHILNNKYEVIEDNLRNSDYSPNASFYVSNNPSEDNSFFIFALNKNSFSPYELLATKFKIDTTTLSVEVDNNYKKELIHRDLADMIIVVPGSCDSYWIINYSLVDNGFLTTSVDISGVGIKNVKSSFELEIQDEESYSSYSYLNFNNRTSKLYLIGKKKTLLEFNFDRKSGKIEFSRKIFELKDSHKCGIRDFITSPDGKLGYISLYERGYYTQIDKNPTIFQLELQNKFINTESEGYLLNSTRELAGQCAFRVTPLENIAVFCAGNSDFFSLIEYPNNIGLECHLEVAQFKSNQFGFSSYQGFPHYVDYDAFKDLYIPLPPEIGKCGTDPISIPIEGEYDKITVEGSPVAGEIEVRDTGWYHVYAERDGCVGEDSFYVYEQQNLSVSMDRDVQSCDKEVTIGPTAESNWIYRWSTGEQESQIKVSKSGEYVLESTSSSGCMSIDTVRVTLSEDLNLDLGEDRTFCAGSTIELDAGLGADSYLWQDGSTDQIIEVNQDGIYTVTVKKGLCTKTDSVEISFKEALDLGDIEEKSLCTGRGVKLGEDVKGYEEYRWNTGEATSEIVASSAGKYEVEVRDGGCSGTKVYEVLEYPLPLVDLGPDIRLCHLDSPIELKTSHLDSTYSFRWQDNGSSKPFRLIAEEGIYTLEVDDGHCANADEIRVEVDPELCDCTVTFPNVLSKSDPYSLVNLDFLPTCAKVDYQLVIFDRWGNLMMQFTDSSAPSLDYIGSLNAGVYIFFYSNQTEYLYPKVGSITIID